MPIADLAEGQEVLAAPEEGAASDHASALIGTKIDVYEASLLHVVLVHETGDVEVLHTTDEHPFHVVETGAWTRADRLRVGDGLSTISGVAELVGIGFGRETVPVYNLSIPGTPTYYVGDHGVWVHNTNVFECFVGSSLFPHGSARKFAKAFDEHRESFSVRSGSKSAQNIMTFQRNIKSFIASARSQQINYFGSGDATVYLRGPGRPYVVLRPDGSWWSGGTRSESQFEDIMTRNFLR